MFSQFANLNALPIETLLEVCSFLSPEDISSASSVTKASNKIAQGNLFWKQKFEMHFPHALSSLPTQGVINWYDEFRKNYKKDYKGLPLRTKKLFSLVKEGDTNGLKNMPMQWSDFDNDFDTKDKNGISLLEWAKIKGNQASLDLFYQRVTKLFIPDKTGFTVDVTKIDFTFRTILHWAIECHQPVNIIDQLILQGAKINIPNNSCSVLQLAAKEGQGEIAELLLQRGANINYRGWRSSDATALLFAIENDHKNVVDVLLKPQYNIDISLPLPTNSSYHQKFNIVAGDTPLQAVIKLGRKDLLGALLDKIANTNISNAVLQLAASKGKAEIVELLLQRGADINSHSAAGATALIEAIEKGHKNVVDVLLKPQYKVDIAIPLQTNNRYHQQFRLVAGDTPLHAAIKLGNKDIVQTLLDNNADINILAGGWNALWLAASEGQAEMVDLLLERGADINARTAGCGATALFIAIENRHQNVVDVLLKPKYNVDITIPLHSNEDYHKPFHVVAGDTPLHVAARSGQAAIVQQLLNKGADIQLRNSKGKMAADVEAVGPQYSNQLKLLDYAIKANSRPTNHYKTSITLFGYTKNFGCSAEQKQKAAEALKEVVFFDKSDPEELSRLREKLKEKDIAEALDQGELGSIYHSFHLK